jgi:hypothetical protein
MRPTERSARKPYLETGFLATLRGLLHAQGTGAPSRPRALATLAALATALGALALMSAPALALKEHAFGSSFGSAGSGPGQFLEPGGVAVNEVALGMVGDVYVVDRGNKRVEWFSPEGKEFKGQFETPPGGFAPSMIAVDNSTSPLDPSAGDVYVVDAEHNAIDKFEANGKYINRLELESLGGGVAVDPEGKLTVVTADNTQAITNVNRLTYSSGIVNELLSTSGISIYIERVAESIAIANNDNLYTIEYGTEDQGIWVWNSAGTATLARGVGGPSGISQATAVAVDTSTDELLIDDGTSVAAFGFAPEPTCAAEVPCRLLGGFGSGALQAGGQLAVDSASDTVYVVEPGGDVVKVFPSFVVPTSVTGEATNITKESMTLHGTVEPEGDEVTSCEFEYGLTTAYGSTAPCSVNPGNSSSPVPVEAEVSGLATGRKYHFRLVAGNANGSHAGIDATARTSPSAPSFIAETASVPFVASTEAVVSDSLTTNGALTSYRVEYGTTPAYGSVTSEVYVGEPEEAVTAKARLAGLEPGVTYYARFVATNAQGSITGSGITFTTSARLGVSSSALPDNRAYELVSSATDNVTVDSLNGSDHGVPYAPGDEGSPQQPDRAAANGNAMVYAGVVGAEGGNGAFGDSQADEWLAKRGSTGWTTSDVTPPTTDAYTEYPFFSSDLSLGIFRTDGVGSIATSPSSKSCGFSDYTRTSDGTYHQFVCGLVFAVNASANGSHVLFASASALTPGAHEGESEPQYGENIYDSVGGSLYQVNVLPEGSPEPAPFAWLGGPPYDAKYSEKNDISPNSYNAVSADGSRIFWTSVSPGGEHGYTINSLYVRENDTQLQSPLGPHGECEVAGDACTVQVDAGEAQCVGEGMCTGGGGHFWTATADGSAVFFTDGHRLTADSTAEPGTEPAEPDLYEYEVATGRLTDLTVDVGGHADVQGVIGASENGEYVYFAANGVLAENENSSGEKAQAGQTNFYVRHGGVTTFIAPYQPFGIGMTALYSENFGDLAWAPGNRIAGVAPDGQAMVFESRQSLTGYANNEAVEVFVYEASTGRLSCASCDPAGVSPTGIENGAALPVPGNALINAAEYMQRWISANGSRVFFDSLQSLVPQDTNGALDVYEWERAASGSEPNNTCSTSSESYSTANGGCVYLLSGGQSADGSYFADADAEGDNVFFTSRGKLTPQAGDENVAMYDARVDGGFPELSTECSGTGCQGVPPAPPIFATPSSVTYAGVGNFEPQPAVVQKPVVKRAKCKKGEVRKAARCVKAKGKAKTKRPGKRAKRRKK